MRGSRRDMGCADFDRWLDEGMSESAATGARAHATGCVRCAEAERAALEIESLLALEPAAAPAELAASVMGRVDAVQARPLPAWSSPAWAVPSGLPWWVQAAAEPGLALAVLLGAVLFHWADALPGLAFRGVLAADAALTALAAHLPALESPASRLGLAVLLLPASFLASRLLYRWCVSSVYRASLARAGAAGTDASQDRIGRFS